MESDDEKDISLESDPIVPKTHALLELEEDDDDNDDQGQEEKVERTVSKGDIVGESVTSAGTRDIRSLLGNGSSKSKKASLTVANNSDGTGENPKRQKQSDTTAGPQSEASIKSKSLDSLDAKAFAQNYFTPNPNFVKGVSTFSHTCTLCNSKYALWAAKVKATDTSKGRWVWSNAKEHIKVCHQKAYLEEIERQKTDQAKQALDQNNEQARAQREELLKKTLSLGVSSVSVAQLLAPADPKAAEPLFRCPPLGTNDEQTLRLLMAYWVAKDGLSQNTFEKEGFRLFAHAIGLELAPKGETIAKAQEDLVALHLKEKAKQLARIVAYSPVPLISIQTDVWSAHDSSQQMGVRLSGIDPLTIEPFSMMLPLEGAIGGSLDAAAEAELVLRCLNRVCLGADVIYAQTTDTASVALLSSAHNNIQSVGCRAHIAALILKDCVKVGDSREYDVMNDDIDDVPTSDNIVERVFLGVVSRAAHFHRSALAARKLADYQAENNMNQLQFRTWAPTRWAGVFEALLRDTEIMNGGGIPFMESYVREGIAGTAFPKKAKQRLLAGISEKNGAANAGLIVLSILRPLYELTLKLQADTISLADALIAICHTYEALVAADLQVFLQKTTSSAQPKTVMVSTLAKSFVCFRRSLAKSLKRRLLDNIDDLTLLNIALDPTAYAFFYKLANCPIAEADEDDFELDEDDAALEVGKNEIPPVLIKCAKEITYRLAVTESNLVQRAVFVLTRRTGAQALDSVEECDDVTETESGVTPSTAMLKGERGSCTDSGAGSDLLSKMERILAQQPRSVASESAIDRASQRERFILRELDAFRMARVKIQKGETDLTFWKAKCEIFPNLYHCFLGIRSVRPATARLESMFSIASNLTPANRMSMSTSTLNNCSY